MARRKNKQSHPRLILLFLLIVAGFCSYHFYFANTTEDTEVTTAFAEKANQALVADGQTSMPLILQTDPIWANESYGTGGSDPNTLAIKGCAIASLAMVLSYYQSTDVTPTEILNWSGNTYYESGSGTAWTIFAAFASQYGLEYHDLGTDQTNVQAQLDQNKPVIVSVKPGEFTTVGHIMVLMKDVSGNGVKVFDPNDSPTKKHYQQTYSLSTILNQASNAWSFT